MAKKYVKEDLFEMSTREIYKIVLQGKERKIFPKGFWAQPEASERAKVCVKFMIEEKLKWTDEELKEQLSKKVFKDNNLGGMLKIVFNSSPFSAINLACPKKFKEWEFKNVPMNFWTLENGIEATKWLIEEKLKWSDEEIKEKLSQKTFKDNNLSGMLYVVFKGSPYSAMNSIYPDRFKPWSFKQTPRNFWTLETGIETTKWLIEEKLKWTDDEIKENLSYKIFRDNNLSGMLNTVFNSSPFSAVNSAYPNKFKGWEFKNVPLNFWTLKTGIEATKWLIEEKLKWRDKEIKEKLSINTFKDNNLSGMLQYVFNGSPYKAINEVYPNRFKRWELKSSVPKNYWRLETGIESTRWLIEEKLKWSDEEIKENISKKVFQDTNLGGMLNITFKDSPFGAINAAYPNKFKKQDFKSYQYNVTKK